MIGKVKWFNAQKGWGFITGTDGKDVFAHHEFISGTGFRSLNAGDVVEFDVVPNVKGDRARDIKVIEAAAPQPAFRNERRA